MSRCCSECGEPIEENYRFVIESKDGGNLFISNMLNFSFSMISKGKVRSNYHKDCVKEDESSWVRNSRGVIISKGKYKVFTTNISGMMIKVRR